MAAHSTERQASLSSDKLLAILECISSNHAPMRLQDLAEQSGITQSTVLRYLRALQNANYVYQDDDTLQYGLTWKVCKLAENLNSPLGLRNIANPFVNRLANTMQMGVSLVVARDNQIVYLDCIDHPNALYKPQYIGRQAPMHAVASGKLLLSAYSGAKIDAFIHTCGLSQLTPHTITDRDTLMKELERIRTQGYAMDNEECEIGMSCVAYPLFDYNCKICASLAIIGNVDEVNDCECLETIHAELKRAAQEISLRLGNPRNDL